MIIILEGLNGVGKTGAAKDLVSMGYRLYRPLREDHSLHWQDRSVESRSRTALESELAAARVPFNSYLEDVFAADAIAQIGVPCDIVLDRSLPSSIAYGEIKGEIKGPEHRAALESYWHRRLTSAGVEIRYFWLSADHSVARKRAGGRYPPNNHLAVLEASFNQSFEVARKAGFKTYKVNTTKATAIQQIEAVFGD